MQRISSRHTLTDAVIQTRSRSHRMLWAGSERQYNVDVSWPFKAFAAASAEFHVSASETSLLSSLECTHLAGHRYFTRLQLWSATMGANAKPHRYDKQWLHHSHTRAIKLIVSTKRAHTGACCWYQSETTSCWMGMLRGGTFICNQRPFV